MITIKGEDAVIEIDIIDILDGRSRYSSVICNFYYKNNDILFTSKKIEICYFELESLHYNLRNIRKNLLSHYLFTSERDVVTINFVRDQYSSDIFLLFKLYLEWESDSCFQGKLRISQEQMQDFIKEIHYLMVLLKEE